MTTIEAIARTLISSATPGMKRKDLIAKVKEQHPDASKKEIVRAAFYALTDGTSLDEEKARDLHAFAISERASETEDPVAKRAVKSKRDKPAAKAAPSATH